MTDIKTLKEVYSNTKNQLNKAMNEFLSSDIFEGGNPSENEKARYYAAINLLTSLINDIAGCFCPEVGEHEFAGILSRISAHYLEFNQIKRDEGTEPLHVKKIEMTEEEFEALMDSVKDKVKKQD